MKYDILLMSEVIYKKENYEKVMKVIEGFMDGNGVTLLATKKYYYGVGGNLNEFLDCLDSQFSQFQYKELYIADAKISNKRSIIEIKYRWFINYKHYNEWNI